MAYLTWNLSFVDMTDAEASTLREEGLIYQPEPEDDPAMHYPEDQPEEGSHRPDAWERACKRLDALREKKAVDEGSEVCDTIGVGSDRPEETAMLSLYEIEIIDLNDNSSQRTGEFFSWGKAADEAHKFNAQESEKGSLRFACPIPKGKR